MEFSVYGIQSKEITYDNGIRGGVRIVYKMDYIAVFRGYMELFLTGDHFLK